MSIYEKDSYSQSKGVFLAGPIEWWWQENRFNSEEARIYRAWREALSEALVLYGFLVYRPFDAFKGDWNERFQDVNDYVLDLCDLVIDMTPPGVVALGTEHEIERALVRGTPTLFAPPPDVPPMGCTVSTRGLSAQAERVAERVDAALRGVLD